MEKYGIFLEDDCIHTFYVDNASEVDDYVYAYMKKMYYSEMTSPYEFYTNKFKNSPTIDVYLLELNSRMDSADTLEKIREEYLEMKQKKQDEKDYKLYLELKKRFE